MIIKAIGVMIAASPVDSGRLPMLGDGVDVGVGVTVTVAGG